jgi:parallel beta-helix repeat protein
MFIDNIQLDGLRFVRCNPVQYPDCTIKTNDSIWEGQEIVASVPLAGKEPKYDWNITSGGIINSRRPYTNQICWKALNPGKVNITVKVSNSNGTCTRTVERMISERQIKNVTEDENLNEMIKTSENKILLLENGTYNDSLVINEKNIKIKSKKNLGAVLNARGNNTGILIDNTNGVSIEDIKLEDCKCGIIIYNSNDCAIKGNDIINKNKPGIFVDNSSDNMILNNTIKSEIGGLGCGILFGNISDNNTIKNNDIKTTISFAFALNGIEIENILSDKFDGKIFDDKNKINCSINCNMKTHKLHCANDSEDRDDCSQCTLCAGIERNNKLECIQ